jgi:hypothetical protein
MILRRLPDDSEDAVILHELLKEPTYDVCLKKNVERYKLFKHQVHSCSEAMYYEFSKHAVGDPGDLHVHDTEHTMTEVAATESIFGALKELGCFRGPVTIHVK